ncbi:MAG: preprotein translocase subunit SecA [Verrucomicrobia bacterium]|nr:preprotein translocase subunit SecA [Verrucomicrobiota bacterium]MDE3047372.1 preprotein translocase subunit SecA [Verrucomicrobiota bacterium]
MFGLIKKLFGTQQSRLLKKYWQLVPQVNAWEEEYQSLSDDELKAKTVEFKERLAKGESLDSLLPEAFGAVKNVCRRLCGTDVHVSGYDQKWDMIPYDVQIVGAIAMYHGSIAEMQTGEGKTLTASMPLYLHAITGKPVHLVTVNDYLAKRDCEWIGSIFRRLGLSVAYLTNDVHPFQRQSVYAADIVYGTASEFGFDHLRDNSMASHKNEQVQRGYYFAMVDEIDSILIDEARTPLIISGPVRESRQMYDELKEGVAHLVRIQRDHCNRIATDARRVLETLGVLEENGIAKKWSRAEEQKKEEAFKQLWLVSKGTPRNKILKRLKENPDIRAEIDKWETYFFGESNKEEKFETLSDLYIVVDERNNEYELTDKGIRSWGDAREGKGADDFVMLDLGHEYHLIDQKTLSEPEKMQERMALREEDAKRKERAHNLRQMLRAHLLMEKDIDYIVQEGKIVIIDENTGRPQPGRRFSDGLHQAIEAKEQVAIQGETQTYATITLQNYFRMYERLAGMTGTAMTEANEFKEIYKLDVLEIPTYRNCARKDFDDEIYMTEREKYIAILKEIKEVHGKGRPILIGTESVEVSEKLSRILKQNKLEHTILNAKNHAHEAEIIAEAGKQGKITLATNMAGRGTDIKLKEGVRELGGLHVIGTTRHHSRRIDRQLRGRSGRLGDPGSSKFFVSFEDSLMRLFASPRMTALLQRFRPPEGEPISAKVLNKSIETAQKRVEQRNYTIRKHTLEYDDVMNKQRQEVYSFRNDLLFSNQPVALAEELIEAVAQHLIQNKEALAAQFPVALEEGASEKEILEKILSGFKQKIVYQRQLLSTFRPELNEAQKTQNVLNEVVRNLMIRKIDQLWQEHLLHIDHLRSDVHMRTVGQKDPLLEFKHESFALFERFSIRLREEIARDLFRFEMMPQQPPEPAARRKRTQVIGG